MKTYIEFELIKNNPKTKVYSVKSIRGSVSLGVVSWFGKWRRYAFFPEEDTVFDSNCLEDIKNFMDNLMKERELMHNE